MFRYIKQIELTSEIINQRISTALNDFVFTAGLLKKWDNDNLLEPLLQGDLKIQNLIDRDELDRFYSGLGMVSIIGQPDNVSSSHFPRIALTLLQTLYDNPRRRLRFYRIVTDSIIVSTLSPLHVLFYNQDSHKYSTLFSTTTIPSHYLIITRLNYLLSVVLCNKNQPVWHKDNIPKYHTDTQAATEHQSDDTHEDSTPEYKAGGATLYRQYSLACDEIAAPKTLRNILRVLVRIGILIQRQDIKINQYARAVIKNTLHVDVPEQDFFNLTAIEDVLQMILNGLVDAKTYIDESIVFGIYFETLNKLEVNRGFMGRVRAATRNKLSGGTDNKSAASPKPRTENLMELLAFTLDMYAKLNSERHSDISVSGDVRELEINDSSHRSNDGSSNNRVDSELSPVSSLYDFMGEAFIIANKPDNNRAEYVFGRVSNTCEKTWGDKRTQLRTVLNGEVPCCVSAFLQYYVKIYLQCLPLLEEKQEAAPSRATQKPHNKARTQCAVWVASNYNRRSCSIQTTDRQLQFPSCLVSYLLETIRFSVAHETHVPRAVFVWLIRLVTQWSRTYDVDAEIYKVAYLLWWNNPANFSDDEIYTYARILLSALSSQHKANTLLEFLINNFKIKVFGDYMNERDAINNRIEQLLLEEEIYQKYYRFLTWVKNVETDISITTFSLRDEVEFTIQDKAPETYIHDKAALRAMRQLLTVEDIQQIFSNYYVATNQSDIAHILTAFKTLIDDTRLLYEVSARDVIKTVAQYLMSIPAENYHLKNILNYVISAYPDNVTTSVLAQAIQTALLSLFLQDTPGEQIATASTKLNPSNRTHTIAGNLCDNDIANNTAAQKYVVLAFLPTVIDKIIEAANHQELEVPRDKSMSNTSNVSLWHTAITDIRSEELSRISEQDTQVTNNSESIWALFPKQKTSNANTQAHPTYKNQQNASTNSRLHPVIYKPCPHHMAREQVLLNALYQVVDKSLYWTWLVLLYPEYTKDIATNRGVYNHYGVINGNTYHFSKALVFRRLLFYYIYNTPIVDNNKEVDTAHDDAHVKNVFRVIAPYSTTALNKVYNNIEWRTREQQFIYHLLGNNKGAQTLYYAMLAESELSWLNEFLFSLHDALGTLEIL